MNVSAGGHDLIAAARDVARLDEDGAIGSWQRAAALLARQGVEAAMSELWQLRSPAMRDVRMSCQLLCLGSFLRDPVLAGRVRLAWEGLSRAVHWKVYDLPPTVSELDAWMSSGWDLCDAVARELTAAAAG